MSWNSCLEICSSDPRLQSPFYKVQDYLSTRAPGDRIMKSDFQGLKASWELLQPVLTVLEEKNILSPQRILICPNSGCRSELEQYHDQIQCEDCDEFFELDECNHEEVLVLIEQPIRSPDTNWNTQSQFKRTLVLIETNQVVYGERDESYIYLPKAYHNLENLLLRDGSSILRLLSSSFQPEYGNQTRCFAYTYIVQSEGGFMQQQNVNITGSHINVGDISQERNEWNYTPEQINQFESLMVQIQETARRSNVHDARLLNLLEKAIESKADKKTALSTLNQLVGWAADYSTVISPFIPQITAMLIGTPIG